MISNVSQDQKIIGALVYCRVSTADQVKNFSLESQKKVIFDFCERAGMTVIETFTGAGESAKTADRPEFQKLLRYAIDHRDTVQAVVVYDWSRFTRNLQDRMNIEFHLKQLGISVVSATQSSLSREKDDDPDIWLGQTINSVIDEHMIRKLRVNVKRGMVSAFNQGFWPFQAPLGYIQVRDENGRSKCLLNAKTADWVRNAFKLADEGFSSRQILAQLRANGVMGRRGLPLSLGTVKSTLTNPFYYGVMRARNFGEKVGQHQPLISVELFQRVQAKYRGHQINMTFLKDRQEFPFRRFLKCGTCDHFMVAYWTRRPGKKYPYYGCRKCGITFRAEKLENSWISWLDEKIQLTLSDGPNKVSTGVRWLRSSFDDKRKFQELWFPKGIHFDDANGFWVENNLLPGLSVENIKQAPCV